MRRFGFVVRRHASNKSAWSSPHSSPRPARALTADEEFFMENDRDPTEALLADLERERLALEAKEKEIEQTPEWKAYEEEVERAIWEVEEEWLQREDEPITKETVKVAHERMDKTIDAVQKKHETNNAKLIAEYERFKQKKLAKPEQSESASKDEKLSLSKEYAALLDKYK
jgi:hypothetical protein